MAGIVLASKKGKRMTMATKPTRAQLSAYLDGIKALADMVKVKGSIPSGHLYAMVMGHIDLSCYENMIGVLIRADVIRKTGDVLTWNVVQS